MPTAGRKAKLMVSGTTTAFVGEATTMSLVNTKYQITAAAKRVLDRTIDVSVHKYSADQAAEQSTNTTTIKLTNHGLVAGDLIINTTRSSAKRVVLTKPDANTITVAAITSQTAGDTIQKCPKEVATTYTLNRLSGYVIYASAASRTIYITGSYLPMSEAASAKEFTYSLEADNTDSSVFGSNYVLRKQTMKDVKGSLSQWWIDSYFIDAILAGNPIIVEFYMDRTSTFLMKAWVVLASEEISAAVDGLVEESVEFEGSIDDNGLCITFD